MSSPKLLLLLTLFIGGLTACDKPTEAVATAADATAANVDELPVEQDQTKFTRNVDPSTVKDESLPTPASTADEPVPAENNERTLESTPSKKDVMPVSARKTESSAVKMSQDKADPAPISPQTSGEADAPSPTSPTATEDVIRDEADVPDAQVPTTTAPSEPTPAPRASAPDHAPWDALLRKHVADNGDVDYAGFKRDEAKLDAYLATLQQSAPKDWGRNESLAYWINAYNAFTIKRVLQHYPVNSIQDISGGDPWKVKWIEIDGKTYSLNNIEHDIIRPTYREPRIHFAVNCAANSCPPLPNRAFTAGNLNGMLEANTRAFIRNSDYNQTSGPVRVSKIFDWYGVDFGDLRTYLNKYLATPIPAGTEIGFKDYDWALNKQ